MNSMVILELKIMWLSQYGIENPTIGILNYFQIPDTNFVRQLLRKGLLLILKSFSGFSHGSLLSSVVDTDAFLGDLLLT